MGREQFISPNEIDRLVAGGLDVDFPTGAVVAQKFSGPRLDDVRAEVRAQLEDSRITARVRPGMRVAVGVGSRGIGCLFEVVSETVNALKRMGADPFIVPAMGSHGGATPEGQGEVLATYGITEASVGAPVETSMEVVELGRTAGGVRVYFSRPAFEADAVVPVGRIKPHTSFRGPIESGIHKMLAIGFGKHKGASSLHSFGFARFAEFIPEVGQFILEHVTMAFGVGILENADEEAAMIQALLPEEVAEREPELLKRAQTWMGRILFDQFDLLIVDELGKDISGDGMDPNVTGRFSQPFVTGGPDIQKIVVLDLTEQTHGNACGIGAADITTQTVFDKLDFVQTYTNAITSTVLSVVKLPVVMPTANSAVALGLATLNRVTPKEARVVRIKNTLELDRIWISQALVEQAKGRNDIEVLEPTPLSF